MALSIMAYYSMASNVDTTNTRLGIRRRQILNNEDITSNSNLSKKHTFVNVYDKNNKVKDRGKCSPLASLPIKICIHDVEHDRFVSGTISHGGFWDMQEVHLFRNILHQDPELNVIDIGANIGQFTLLAAYEGRKVVSVEAKLKHIEMIHHALVVNGYQSQVTLVHNTISNKRSRVSLASY